MRGSVLNFRMAVRTEQHALLRLQSRRGERPRHSLTRERKRLERRIDVVEVQSTQRACVATQRARAAGFLDEYTLDLAPTPVDRAGATKAAPESVHATAHECRRPMDRAHSLGC